MSIDKENICGWHRQRRIAKINAGNNNNKNKMNDNEALNKALSTIRDVMTNKQLLNKIKNNKQNDIAMKLAKIYAIIMDNNNNNYLS